ncbi:DUF499 domain-containing protein [Methanosarcina sp.]|uniref:DUF499 domain-containing protein n=1 Tax=Methanosarcina sp. TaxID=2213 RepID=UPI002C72EF53|nr:DUF499 domain-containing protein [Methanosarcina sp.]HOW14315.1 DUF499 domain-containing protein [Methanosarcina sp.]
MQSIENLCKARNTIFDRNRRDIVLDISDILEDKIDPYTFFEENYLTEGMRLLFKEAFRRFSNESDSSVFKLTQAMGGGKTHCMIGLALLAKNPSLREKVMGEGFAGNAPDSIKVVAFNGRESDAPYGIWGSIAEQLGKKELFKDYYTPLQAPGKTAWVNLLKGEKLLILLDELPPYFENAKSKTIGNTDLSVVTKTALSNLLVAIGSKELSQVCIVLSDLKATYESGSQQINQALHDFENEVHRGAVNLEPVGLNTDEVYQILKKRIFSKLPDNDTILSIARDYGDVIKIAGQMDLTHVSPEKFVQQVRESYPFHPAIKDLYARFRENPGFQQTRGLIRFMRVLVSHLYEDGGAKNAVLIHPHMIDLNHPEMVSEINLINPTLGNAISHDIASDGNSVSEMEDLKRCGSDCQDVCKLVLMASLANIENSVLGLTASEIITDIAAPGRNLTTLPDSISTLESQLCWYLHRANDGKVYFKNTENLVARLRSLAESYGREAALKEVKEFLQTIFTPEIKDCYQEFQILPAVDEITISQDKVKLILYEPYGGDLHPHLQEFYNSLDYKNRVCFLSGQRDTMNNLISVGREYKAIHSILREMDSKGVRADDTQRIIAQDLRDNIVHRLLSASRETFTRLHYPHNDDLRVADLTMNFEGNKCRGEELIKTTLTDKQKFTQEVDGDTFRKKCEQRLFTQQTMQWSEIKKRAAILTKWQWHHPNALDNLKDEMLRKEQWRMDGGYVDKGPFPAPSTAVQVMEWNRNDDTGEVTLKVIPVNGNTIYYDTGGEATSASAKVDDFQNFVTNDMRVSFLCVDSKGVHEKGAVYTWSNSVTLKKKVFGNGEKKTVELKAAPVNATIKYTTDGSNPKNAGGIYSGPFDVDRSVRVVLAFAEKEGVESEVLKIDIDWGKTNPGLKLDEPVSWKRSHSKKSTKDSFDFTGLLKKHHAHVPAARISVIGKSWVDLSVDSAIELSGEQIEKLIESLREIYSDGQVSIDAPSIKFVKGQDLKDFADAEKTDINMDEVSQ